MVEGDGQDGVAAWLRLKECPGCGYSLVGLMEEGVCPECGRGYDQKVVVVSGRGRGNLAAGGTWREVLRQGGYMVFLLAMFSLGTRQEHYGVTFLVWGLALAVIVGAGLYARLFGLREPQMQLWISEEGVGQWVPTPEGRAAEWVARNIYWFIFPALIVIPWAIFWARTAGAIEVMGGIYGALGLLVWCRMRARDVGHGPKMWNWEVVDEIMVEEAARGRARIRCYTMPRYWGKLLIYRECRVDVEVACPAGVVEGVRGVMERLREEGKR